MASSSGAGDGKVVQVNQNIYPQPGMSEEQIGRAAAQTLNFELRGH
jgi:hypothetical protein